MQQLLRSLQHAKEDKEKLLLKSGDQKEVVAEDIFEAADMYGGALTHRASHALFWQVNPDYTTAKMKVSIPLLVMQTDEGQVICAWRLASVLTRGSVRCRRCTIMCSKIVSLPSR